MTQPPVVTSEPQEMLSYARREDTGLASAYRLVGWFYLAVGSLRTLAVPISLLAMSKASAGRMGQLWQLGVVQCTHPALHHWGGRDDPDQGVGRRRGRLDVRGRTSALGRDRAAI